MMIRQMTPRLSLSLMTLALLAAPIMAQEPVIKPIRVKVTEQPQYPPAMAADSYPRGEVTLLLQVDSENELMDLMVLRSSHEAFSREALRTVPRWRFEAGEIDGTPATMRQILKLHFQPRGVVTSETVSTFAARRLDQIVGLRVDDRVARREDLDAPLRTVHAVPPGPVPTEAGEGMVVLDFFIDPEGRARMPVVREMANETLALAALDAIEQWRFEPPRRRGQPVVVQARQPFVFRTESEESPED